MDCGGWARRGGAHPILRPGGPAARPQARRRRPAAPKLAALPPRELGLFAGVRAGGMALIQFFAGNATRELGLFNAKAVNEKERAQSLLNAKAVNERKGSLCDSCSMAPNTDIK
jgi:hypothetical protein